MPLIKILCTIQQCFSSKVRIEKKEQDRAAAERQRKHELEETKRKAAAEREKLVRAHIMCW